MPYLAFMKTLIYLSITILFASRVFAQSTTDSAKIAYTFTYNLVPKNDSSQIRKKIQPAQNDSTIVSGKLVSENSNEGVPLGAVILVTQKASMLIATRSNLNGEFRLSIPNRLLRRKIKIKIQALGYDTKIVVFKKKQLPLHDQTIALILNTRTLN